MQLGSAKIYTPQEDSEKWWWQPLPPFVVSALSVQEIEEICTMDDKTLVNYHNDHIADGFGDTKNKARLWVAQGESWRRNFTCVSVSGVAKRKTSR